MVGCPTGEDYTPPDLIYHYKDFKVGKNPTSIRASDFNGDGFTDLVTTNIQGNSLSLLLGTGDGGFESQKIITACQEPRNVAVDDFNLDHFADLVVACSGDHHVLVFLGQGDGTFLRGSQYAVRRTPVSITTGDFNEDFLPDMVVALRNDKIQVFLGMGNGKFRVGPLYEYGDTPTSIATADFNSDTHLDIAVTNGGPMSHAVSIWLGVGDGTFLAPKDYRTGKRPLSVSFADFNSDHRLDLLVINGEMNTITVFLGNGDGTFQEGKDSGGDAGPNHGVAQDFNGDKIPDVAVVNIQSASLIVDALEYAVRGRAALEADADPFDGAGLVCAVQAALAAQRRAVLGHQVRPLHGLLPRRAEALERKALLVPVEDPAALHRFGVGRLVKNGEHDLLGRRRKQQRQEQ